MKKLSQLGMFAAAVACLFLSPSYAVAQDKDEKGGDKKAEQSGEAGEKPKEEISVTDHTIKIGGQTIPYKATAQTILLKDEKGAPVALVYSTAYTRSDVKDPSTRPVSFLYNGGPGSSSLWLHMGSFAPRRVATVNAGITPPAPSVQIARQSGMSARSFRSGFYRSRRHRFQYGGW